MGEIKLKSLTMDRRVRFTGPDISEHRGGSPPIADRFDPFILQDCDGQRVKIL